MTNTKFVAIAFVLIIVNSTSTIAVAEAEDPPEFIGMQAGPKANVALVQSVRDELKLTADQQAELKALSDRFRETFRDLHSKNELTPSPEFPGQLNSLEAETAAELARILSAEQRHRLDQIALQAIGLLAASQPYTAEKLKLTSQQSRRVASALQEYYTKMRAAKRNEKLDWKTFQTIRGETEAKISAILTREQNEGWKKLIGKEFDVASLYEKDFER